MDECPVDCIYEGARMLYIHPDECVDCGACEPVCPVKAIYYEDDVPEPLRPYIDENVKFFTDTLPGRPIPWDHREEPRNSVPSMPIPRWWPPCRRRATDAHRREPRINRGWAPGAPSDVILAAAACLGRAAQHRQRCR